MSLALWDWLIIAGYFVLSAGIGLAYARRAGQRDQRQGGLGAQPPALGLAPRDQGDLRTGEGLPVSLHGRGVGCHPGRGEGSCPGWQDPSLRSG